MPLNGTLSFSETGNAADLHGESVSGDGRLRALSHSGIGAEDTLFRASVLSREYRHAVYRAIKRLYMVRE